MNPVYDLIERVCNAGGCFTSVPSTDLTPTMVDKLKADGYTVLTRPTTYLITWENT